MRLVNLWCLLVAVLALTCLSESKPFMMSMGQSIGGALFSVFKFFDNTPTYARNRTSMKRAPAFASKYSIHQSVETAT